MLVVKKIRVGTAWRCARLSLRPLRTHRLGCLCQAHGTRTGISGGQYIESAFGQVWNFRLSLASDAAVALLAWVLCSPGRYFELYSPELCEDVEILLSNDSSSPAEPSS